MSLTPRLLKQYHVFLASPGDVGAERQRVRRFFDDYNRHTAHIWNARFDVVDWENYATIGVGRPQELITQQMLEKYRDSLALVIGIMGQRFGSPSGKAESGTEEEFNWAMESHKATGFPEIKWFFRKAEQLTIPADPEQALAAVAQWQRPGVGSAFLLTEATRRGRPEKARNARDGPRNTVQRRVSPTRRFRAAVTSCRGRGSALF